VVVEIDRATDANVAAARAILELDDATLDTIVARAEEIVPDILWV